ncbi:FtsX-like permease family protein [Cohnella algarum]|uniref:FtsX-like permease family protein n=1 Tax=Cohnella algarum TaxID=2044859 RepID=UPI001967C613|nr:ABC transporter permease [Cohnella algarum]MBN2982371.1 ABC transporter permease [Cohnella algarum]
MYSRIIRNDMIKSKTVTLATVLFVAAAGMLVSLAAILTVHLSSALDTLMKTAKTPHFMQMHSGDIDTARLAAFAERYGNVEEFQVLEFLNIEGARIRLGDRSLAGSVQDNGFSVQSESFDYLLDLDGNVIRVSDGELYVPVAYMKDHTVKAGDRAFIGEKEFTVAGFLRDSQMNSALSSSKRFLVSEGDFAAIRNAGSVEYLIEFRLKDLSKLGAFETAYASAGLEANGPTVTYSLFQMLNALSDGLMIGVILLVSLLVVAIALMCIRFTLLAKIEDDYREIGVMKAIGMRVSDMKKIYLAKYAAIAAGGGVLGYALSFLFKDMLLENIRLYMGKSGNPFHAALFGIVGIALVFLAVVAYAGRVLNRFRSISAAEAIRFGSSREKIAGGRRFNLSENRRLGTNLFLGLRDVLARKRLYATMLAVLVISSFILIVPQNLHHTISSSGFVQYMGIGSYDLRIDIQQTDRISEKTADIADAMRNDRDIARYAVLTTKTFRTTKVDGSEELIKIELGDHSVFPIRYSSGRAPAADDEIALSALNADELGKKVGDVLALAIEGKEKSFAVSGIYADLTNGGKTAKAAFADDSAETMWSVVSAELADPALVGSKASEYADKFGYAKV